MMDMNILEKQELIVKRFAEIDDWQDKYKLIIEQGKKLPSFPPELQIEENRVSGCQSQVWLFARLEEDKVLFSGDSDALIVKGLLSFLLEIYSGHSPEEILNNPPAFFDKIGMQAHLSVTRANGLARIIKQMQFYAIAFQSLLQNADK